MRSAWLSSTSRAASVLLLGMAFASPAWGEPKAVAAPSVAYKGVVPATLEPALPPSARELQAAIEKCQVCHQPSGQGFRGAPPVPRLAGQQTEYFENQLRAFIEHRRVHPIMGNVAQSLSPAMQRAVAEHFRALSPKPIGGAPAELEAEGRKIYREGAADAGVVPCAFCHGPEAKGNGLFPRLAGQLREYILDKLQNWSHERGQNPAKQDTSAIMQPIAHSLTKAQIEAVAAYLNNLE